MYISLLDLDSQQHQIRPQNSCSAFLIWKLRPVSTIPFVHCRVGSLWEKSAIITVRSKLYVFQLVHSSWAITCTTHTAHSYHTHSTLVHTHNICLISLCISNTSIPLAYECGHEKVLRQSTSNLNDYTFGHQYEMQLSDWSKLLSSYNISVYPYRVTHLLHKFSQLNSKYSCVPRDHCCTNLLSSISNILVYPEIIEYTNCLSSMSTYFCVHRE